MKPRRSSNLQGIKTYIRYSQAEKLKSFCNQNGLSFSDATNQVIDAYFDQKLEKQSSNDTGKILRYLELLNLILQPSLLELLEVSGQLRWLTNDKPKALSTGLEVRKEFESLYKELLELKKHEQQT